MRGGGVGGVVVEGYHLSLFSRPGITVLLLHPHPPPRAPAFVIAHTDRKGNYDSITVDTAQDCRVVEAQPIVQEFEYRVIFSVSTE